MNSSPRSTLESSRAPPTIWPAPKLPAPLMVAVPELAPEVKRLLPWSTSPSALAKVAMATWPTVRVRPLLKEPLIVPSGPTAKLMSVPIGAPSRLTAARPDCVSLSDVTPLPVPERLRLTESGEAAPVLARSMLMLMGVGVVGWPWLSKETVPAPTWRARSVSSPEST